MSYKTVPGVNLEVNIPLGAHGGIRTELKGTEGASRGRGVVTLRGITMRSPLSQHPISHHPQLQ